MDDLDRMFKRLVQNIRMSYPELLGRPFEVTQLYQNLLPYRHNRKELEIETNQDYELALMRLLSGERGYLVVDDALEDAMRRELASKNPDTAAFRIYGSSHVSVAPEAVRRLDPATGAATPSRPSTPAPAVPRTSRAAPAAPSFAPPPPAAAPPAPPAAPAPAAPPARPPAAAAPPAPVAPRGPAAAPPPPPVPRPSAGSSAAGSLGTTSPFIRPSANNPVAPPRSPTPSSSAIARSNAAGTCRYCGGALPSGRSITYCPHCGQNLTIQHCPACSTELEIGWKFCTTCGRGVATTA